MEFMPRITRAQSMDILSSQSNLAGYKAVLDAASEYGRRLPMMMTAAGTIAAARVFVMGVGVAGLQAIATARRLGAMCRRPTSAPRPRSRSNASARRRSSSRTSPGSKARARAATRPRCRTNIRRRRPSWSRRTSPSRTSSSPPRLIPGRPAPRLISDAQIATMRPGSVIVDLAVEQGGNVEGAVPGEVVERHGVRIVGHRNVPSRLAADASALYARNLYNFLSAFWDAEAKKVGAARRRRDRAGRAADQRRQGRQRAAAGLIGSAGNWGTHNGLHHHPVDLRAGVLRRLFRGLVGDAGAAHAADGGDQRDLVGDHRRRADRERGAAVRTCRNGSGWSRW